MFRGLAKISLPGFTGGKRKENEKLIQPLLPFTIARCFEKLNLAHRKLLIGFTLDRTRIILFGRKNPPLTNY